MKQKSMKDFKTGVGFYSTGKASITVFFPENEVKCQYCHRFLRYEDYAKRYSCRLTDERLLYPFDRVGFDCPLEFEEGEGEGNE
jgi:hypothetical protein